jgi:hypothetical protein
MSHVGPRIWRSISRRVGDPCSYPFSVGFPAFFQPAMPCGMMYTFV